MFIAKKIWHIGKIIANVCYVSLLLLTDTTVNQNLSKVIICFRIMANQNFCTVTLAMRNGPRIGSAQH